MPYGKSALLERRIRALVRETAKDVLLREATEAEIKSERQGTPYKIEKYVVQATGPLAYVYFEPGEQAQVGTSTPKDEGWAKWAGLINSATPAQEEAALDIISALPATDKVKADFLKAGEESAKTAAPKVSEALKQIQKMLALDADLQTGTWNNASAQSWSDYIDQISPKLPEGNFPANIKTSWRTASKDVRISKDIPTTPYAKDFAGMLEFMKQVESQLGPYTNPGAAPSQKITISSPSKNGQVSKGAKVSITASLNQDGKNVALSDIALSLKSSRDSFKSPISPSPSVTSSLSGDKSYAIALSTDALQTGYEYSASVSAKGPDGKQASSEEIRFSLV